MSEPAGDPLHLTIRAGLPDDMRVLLADYPRERWGEPTLAEMARFWLGVHDNFRRHHAHMVAIADHWRSGHSDLRGLHGRLIPSVDQFLQHLDMHHRIESGQYFPIFRRVEPRIAHGVDLLDRDHDAVHADLEALLQAAIAFHQDIQTDAASAGDNASRLAEVLDAMGPRVLRHLHDEEEIVIPLIATRADEIG
ncbi:MAG: hemerythrin domain-containing protein [Caulobacteraceae bacterium]|nr:hemerythrin domain-containing protein [Caulobacteraceae bacterium]